MSALIAEETQRVRAEEAFGMIDCGRASERTMGWIIHPIFEQGTPPFNRLFEL